MKRIGPVVAATAFVGVTAAALAAGSTPPAKPAAATTPAPAATPAPAMDTTVSSLKDVKWGPGAPALPPGAKMAVMAGDPAAKGFVSLRAEMPKGYTIPPHFHPTDEHVTVLSGTLSFGSGDKIDAKTEKTIKAGGYFTAAAQMHHYATTKTGAVVQVDLEGPFEITYINAADDPRNKKPK